MPINGRNGCRTGTAKKCPSSTGHESRRLRCPLGDGAHARKHLELGQGCQQNTVFQPPPNLPEEPALLSLALVFRMWYWLWPSPLSFPIILASFHNPWFQFDFVYKVVCLLVFFFLAFCFLNKPKSKTNQCVLVALLFFQAASALSACQSSVLSRRLQNDLEGRQAVSCHRF